MCVPLCAPYTSPGCSSLSSCSKMLHLCSYLNCSLPDLERTLKGQLTQPFLMQNSL